MNHTDRMLSIPGLKAINSYTTVYNFFSGNNAEEPHREAGFRQSIMEDCVMVTYRHVNGDLSVKSSLHPDMMSIYYFPAFWLSEPMHFIMVCKYCTYYTYYRYAFD